jgi:DUF4097 and DUF4098 domain-containing protein YvlB
MESRNRTIWIIVAIVVILLCCCVLAAAAVAVGVGWLTVTPFSVGGLSGTTTERAEQTFTVETAPQLTVDNFAGNVTVRAGAAGQIQVVSTKRARGSAALSNIQVQMTQQGNGVVVRATRAGLPSNVSVQLEITAPADTTLDLHTGAGNVDAAGFNSAVKADTGAGSVTIQDVSGTVDAHTGAGSIDVRGATGLARLDTGAGSIDYQGTPEGNCTFQTGTGSIRLTLPAGLNASLDLSTGVGDIQLGGFDVQGQVSKRDVKGTVGSGGQTQIYAHTGTGSIDLARQ